MQWGSIFAGMLIFSGSFLGWVVLGSGIGLLLFSSMSLEMWRSWMWIPTVGYFMILVLVSSFLAGYGMSKSSSGFSTQASSMKLRRELGALHGAVLLGFSSTLIASLFGLVGSLGFNSIVGKALDWGAMSGAGVVGQKSIDNTLNQLHLNLSGKMNVLTGNMTLSMTNAHPLHSELGDSIRMAKVDLAKEAQFNHLEFHLKHLIHETIKGLTGLAWVLIGGLFVSFLGLALGVRSDLNSTERYQTDVTRLISRQSA